MKKKLKEAIENIDMVNNIDGQDFDKEFVGTAPVSYADAVLRARKHREDAKKGCEEQTKLAEEALKKEISNAEHPEPLDALKPIQEKLTLNEGLFESFDDEHLGHEDDVCPKCGKNPCECAVNESCLREASHLIPKEFKRKVLIVEDEASIECVLSTVVNTTSNTLNGGSEERSVGFRVITDSIPSSFAIYFFDEDKQKEFYESVPKKFESVKQFIDYLVDIYNSYPRTSAPYNIENIAKDLGYKDVVNIEESLIRYPNGMEVTDIDLDKALDYQYGTDRDKDNSKYTDDEKQKAVDYWIKKTEPSPYDVSKEEVEPVEESKEDAKVFRVTYKHSPEVFSSVMVKAANEDEAKQKLAVKKPGKDIVGVSVMSDDEVNDMTNRGMSLMEAKVVDDFSSYEPWDAAVSTFDNIQNAGKMNALEQLIDDMYPDGINKTELNDLLAYESDWVYSMLDMPNEEDVDEEGEDGPAIDFEEEE